jgi:phage shock protein A
MNGLIDLPALTTAMTTTGLVDPAAKAALGLGPREWPKVVRIEVIPAGAQAVKLSVSVNPAPNSLKQTDPAGVILRELVKRAQAIVSQSAESRRQEVQARLDDLEKRRAELRESIASLRKRVREAEASGLRGTAGPADSAANRRRQLESELAAKRPQLHAIKEMLPRVAAQPDEMGTALRGLVAAREALAAGLEKAIAQGKGDPLELLRARADLAEARVRAAEWGRVPAFSSSRNLRDELIRLEVDIAALEAQLKALPASPAEPVKPPAEDAQQIRSELLRAEQESHTLEMQYQQVRRDHETLTASPTLVVLDGQPQ